MNFTRKTKVGLFLGEILTIAVVGLMGWGSHVVSTPIIAKQNTLRVEESLQASGRLPIIPAVEAVSVTDFHTARSDYYQPVSSWYKNKHWWKRNAPIVGGAGGGALVGGLLGGGKGAVIGGAVGGGGGYLYKRSRRHHEYYYRHH
jgi:hypothetical protein